MDQSYNFSSPDTSCLNNTEDGEPTAWSLSEFWSIIFTLGLTLIIVLGVLGNTLVIYVCIRTTFYHNRLATIDVYILHLSIADFLFLIFCVPFQGTVYILNDWPYGLTMCKIAYYSQYVTMYASIWILTLMSIDRYVAIGQPLKSVKWRTVGRASRFSIAVWAAAIILSSPWLFLYSTLQVSPEATVCYDYCTSGIDYRKWLILVSFVISFLIPTVIIFWMALLVWEALQTSPLQPFMDSAGGSSRLLMAENVNQTRLVTDTRRRRRVVWMVFALSAWYLLCWLPHSVLLVWLNFDPNAWVWVEDNNWTFFILKIVGHMGTYIHSMLNPVLYSLAYEQFRRRLLNVFKKAPITRKDSSHSAKAPTSFLERQGLRMYRGSQKDDSNEEYKRSRL